MKSSSRLFPVQLLSAEAVGNFAEDIYLIKPQNSADKSVQIAVARISQLKGLEDSSNAPTESKKWWRGGSHNVGKTQSKTPLVFVHGCYQNRQLWYSREHLGLITRLCNLNFDPWFVELRGHGLSPRNNTYASNTLEDYARYDVPAINAFVAEQTGVAPQWVGFGEGAGALLFSLAFGSISATELQGVIGVGNPFRTLPMSGLPLSHWLASPFSKAHQAINERGPEQEPWALRKQLLREGSWLSARGSKSGLDLWHALKESDCNLQWIAAPEDLSVWDEGLVDLYQSKRLELYSSSVTAGALAPENIHSTLRDCDQLDILIQSVLHNAKERERVSELLPPGRIASTV